MELQPVAQGNFVPYKTLVSQICTYICSNVESALPAVWVFSETLSITSIVSEVVLGMYTHHNPAYIKNLYIIIQKTLLITELNSISRASFLRSSLPITE